MTDSRFKFLVITIAVTVVFIVFIWKFDDVLKDWFYEKGKSQINKYVYYDPLHKTLHANRKCIFLNSYNKIERVELDGIVEWRDRNLCNTTIENFCSHCIDDENYELIFQSVQDQLFNYYDK